MFQNLKLPAKITIMAWTTLIIFFLVWWLLDDRWKPESELLDQLRMFGLTWLIIFYFFMFFQTFKYVRIQRSYYLKRKFESFTYFKFLGVPVFRIILINSFFRYFNSRVYFKGKGSGRLKVFVEETRQSETSHLFAFITTLPFQVYLVVKGDVMSAGLIMLWSTLFNIYPMLLQRMNRFYIQKRFSMKE
jgi:hypothetical protein